MYSNRETGDRIRAVREQHKESQQELADALGVKRQIIGYWEQGTRAVKVEDLCAIAARYDVSADYLLGLIDTPTKDPDMKMICEYTGLTENTISSLHDIPRFSEHGLPLLDDFLSGYALYIASDLERIDKATAAAADAISKAQDVSVFPPGDKLDALNVARSELEGSLFAFSETCRAVIRNMFDSYDALWALSRAFYSLVAEEGKAHGND